MATAASSWRLICRRTVSQSFGLLTEGAGRGAVQGRVVVTVVLPQSPAYVAGLAIGDEILAAEAKWHECNMALPPRAAMDSAAIVRLLENENARCISLYVRPRSMSNALAWHLEKRLALVAHSRRDIPTEPEERDAWLHALTETWDAEHRIQDVRRSSLLFPLASPTDRTRTATEGSGSSAIARCQHGDDHAHAPQGSSTSLQTTRSGTIVSSSPTGNRVNLLHRSPQPETRRYVSKTSKRKATASVASSSSDSDAPRDDVALAAVEWPTQLKRHHPPSHQPNCEIQCNRIVVAAQRIRKGDELYV